MIKPVVIPWIILFASVGTVSAQNSLDVKPKSSSQIEQPIEISADHIEQDLAKKTIKARRRVSVRFKNGYLKADKVTINTQTWAGEASGHVFMADDGSQLQSSRATFNLKSKKATAYNVKGKIARDYIIKSKKLQKLSEKHFKLTQSSLTTCKGKLPDWIIDVDFMDVISGDRALFRGGKFKIRNVPILYIPFGYVPLDTTRKSGFLLPSVGSSNIEGAFFNNSYFWAINRQSDATFYLDYMKKRGVRPGLEYRYTPSTTTAGDFRGSFLDDKITGDVFWDVKGSHKQILPRGFRMTSQIDLRGDSNFDKTFNSNTLQRTRRSTNSFINITKRWNNSVLDILSRFRNSTEDNRDDSLDLLPQITHKIQRHQLGKSPFYFNQETSYTLFRTDLNPSISQDDRANFQRMDIHPQVSLPLRPSPWLSFTPTIGFRETYYSKGLGPNNQRLDGFSRHMLDVNAVVLGPRINKIFRSKSSRLHQIKHVIEPRWTYDFIPEPGAAKRSQIKRFDSIDSIEPTNRITYSIIQRLLRKKGQTQENSRTDQILRFEIMQSYDFREESKTQPPGTGSRPLSDLRFDLDSRLFDFLFMNFDTTIDVYNSVFNTFNFDFGIQPADRVSVILERRFTRNASTFIRGTIDLSLPKGWGIQYSTRYDEKMSQFQENDFSVLYDDPCKCWGFAFDFVKRNNINRGIRQDDTRFMLNITLRGIGGFGTRKTDQLIHRRFPALPQRNF